MSRESGHRFSEKDMRHLENLALISETTSAGHLDMIWVAGGTFLMGSSAFYREERPVRAETVPGFWLDRTPVTNATFRTFVEATGYVTLCERPAQLHLRRVAQIVADDDAHGWRRCPVGCRADQ